MTGARADKGTIAMAFVHEALVGVRAQGADVTALLQRAGISPDLLAQPQARVSSATYGALWHAIAEATDDEFFGMDRRRMKAGSFTLLCHAIVHAGTLERALRRALRFLRLVLDDIEGELVREGDTARIVLRDRRDSPDAPPRRAFADGTFLLLMHGLACWLVGRRLPVLRADFRCEEPPYADEWRVLFTPQLHFGQAHTAIAFGAAALDLPVTHDEASMKRFLREAPANFLVKYRNSASLAARIRRRLRDLPPADWPDFDALAVRLGLSAATLRRRLDDEGQSYRAIKNELRRDLAVLLLGDASRSLDDIAAALGFAETSAFHRAFKQWTGSRPGDYRRVLA